MSQKLIVFLRAPILGHVKTRLAGAIGKNEALNAYRCLVTQLLQNLKSLPQIELRFTPDPARGELAQWALPGWTLVPQGDGNLGDRLARAFRHSFGEHHIKHTSKEANRVVIIGSDCPSISVSDIESAWNCLLTKDIVLGPARDGGYWLIGLRELHTELFVNIPWSTDSVLETTLAGARKAGLKYHCLRTLADVDTVEDWEDFKRSIRDPASH
jgi:rSAM/selenodomain-associated transferase 1